MNYIQTGFISLFSLFLFACGGGGSSSGGGTTSAPTPVENVGGTYTGVWTATSSTPQFPDVEPITDDIALTITITGQQVEVRDGGTFVATGTLSATNGFNATSGQFSFSDDDIDCMGEFTFSGTVGNDLAQGESRALSNCTDGSLDVEILTTGPFITNRTNGKLGGTSDLRGSILRFLNQ